MDKYLFKLSNPLTFATVMQENQRLQAVLQNDRLMPLILNVDEVVQCDSAGLALIIAARKYCLLNGKNLIIEGVTQPLQALAEFCQVAALLGNQEYDAR